jgi:hypothetical protein
VTLNAADYEQNITIDSFLEKFRRDKLIESKLSSTTEDFKGNSLVVEFVSNKLLDFFWKQFDS